MIAAFVSAVALVASACGDDSATPATSDEIELTVFAAASLSDAFEDIGEDYQRDNPGASIRFNFLASSDLATQIEEGAPADVFASADEASMERLIDQDLVEPDPRVFAHNKLAIVVPSDNRGGVDALGDLEDDDLVVALCVNECPAGIYAREMFARAGLEVEADSLEPDVKAVVTRVGLGEADAGIAYVTDVLAAAGDVTGIDIASEYNVVATYPVAALRGSERGAGDFVDFVLSRRAQQILARHGFLPR